MKVFSIKTLQFEIGQIAHFCLVERAKIFLITDLARLQSSLKYPVLISFIHKTQTIDCRGLMA